MIFFCKQLSEIMTPYQECRNSTYPKVPVLNNHDFCDEASILIAHVFSSGLLQNL